MATTMWAAWLVVLTALPFTAPFTTLDVADMCGFTRTSHTRAIVSAPDVYSAQPDDSADDVAMLDANGQCWGPIAPTLTPLVTPLSSRTVPPMAVVVGSAEATPPAHTAAARVVTLRL